MKTLILLALLFLPFAGNAKCKPQKAAQEYINKIYKYSDFGTTKPVLVIDNNQPPVISEYGAIAYAYSDGKQIIIWPKAYGKKCTKKDIREDIIHEYIHHVDYAYGFSESYGYDMEDTARRNTESFYKMIWKKKPQHSMFIDYVTNNKTL